MSVQAGIWNLDGRPLERSALEGYSRQLAPYGPDDESIFIDGSVGLLYRPYHRMHSSRLEQQPHISVRGHIVAWDGRLDNREELAAELAGNASAVKTDIEVVSAAFDQWGPDCFRKLIGDWSFASWNRNARVLTLAIDSMAIKHLYYHFKPDSIAWCNDLEALVLQSRDQFELDHEYVADYFARSGQSDHTPYSDIRSLQPGHFVQIREGSSVSRCYWAFNLKSRIIYKKDAEYEEHFRFVFRQAVRRRLRSDTRILADLSGGLDSSSIVCMADDILANEGAETPGVDTYSHFDLGEPEGDDLHYLTIVEAKRGRQGHHLNIAHSANSLLPDLTSFVILPGSLQRKTDSELTREKILERGGYKIRLCGIGGDELAGGVPDSRPELADLIVRGHLWQFVRRTADWSLVKRRPWIYLALRAAAILAPASVQARLTREGQLVPWMNMQFAKSHQLSLRQLGPTGRYGFWLPSRQQCAQTAVGLSWILAWRSQGALTDEEVRYPYLDQDFVEFILSIPREQVIRAGQRRFLMRRALRGLVPDEVLLRRTKGAAARRPLLALADDWMELEKLVASSLVARCGFVDQAKLQQAMLAAKAGNGRELPRLMHTLALEFWLQQAVRHGVIRLSPEIPLETREKLTLTGHHRTAPTQPLMTRIFPQGKSHCQASADKATNCFKKQ